MKNQQEETGAFDGLIKKIIVVIPKWVKPNHITMFRLVLVFVLIVLFLSDYFALACIIFVIASSSDAFDGALARQRKQITKTGSALDPVVDKILIISIIILFSKFIPWPIFILVILSEIYMTVGAYIFYKKRLKIKSNIYGKLKMNFEILAIILLFYKLVFNNKIGDIFSSIAIIMFCLVVFLTILCFMKHIGDSLS